LESFSEEEGHGSDSDHFPVTKVRKPRGPGRKRKTSLVKDMDVFEGVFVCLFVCCGVCLDIYFVLTFF
jgi:hypothetical protein